MDFKTVLSEFLKWRVKHISDKRFLIILSILIGVVMGLVGSLLKFLITIIEEEVREGILMKHLKFIYFFFPLLGIALVVLYIRNFVAKKRLSQSVPFVLYSIGKRKGLIQSVHMYGHLIASSITVGLGGSVGLEGPSVVTGSAIGSNISQLFHLNQIFFLILVISLPLTHAYYALKNELNHVWFMGIVITPLIMSYFIFDIVSPPIIFIPNCIWI